MAFLDASNQSADQVRSVDTAVTQLQDQWQGATQAKFYEEYREWQGQMKKYVEVLKNIGDQLNSIAKAFEDTDQDIARQIAGR
jgi:WXG100 family type VII secretion target